MHSKMKVPRYFPFSFCLETVEFFHFLWNFNILFYFRKKIISKFPRKFVDFFLTSSGGWALPKILFRGLSENWVPLKIMPCCGCGAILKIPTKRQQLLRHWVVACKVSVCVDCFADNLSSWNWALPILFTHGNSV